MNILHDISDKRITADEFIAVIEIPKGSKKKYEIDKETGMLTLDRMLASGMYYPMNYGFIPRTLCEDGDALDVCVITGETLDPLTLVKCKPVGLVRMIDCGERDEKIIAVPVDDPNNDVPKNVVNEIIYFFKTYKAINPKKVVEVKEMEDTSAAKKMINEAKELYNKNGGKK
jgi:inorganic pyrophosphatase